MVDIPTLLRAGRLAQRQSSLSLEMKPALEDKAHLEELSGVFIWGAAPCNDRQLEPRSGALTIDELDPVEAVDHVRSEV